MWNNYMTKAMPCTNSKQTAAKINLKDQHALAKNVNNTLLKHRKPV